MTLPEGARRLFPPDLAVLPEGDFVIERLLEEGDSADLRWLASHRGEAALGEWFGRCGGRRLSRRSRAFWALVLDRAPSLPAPGAEELWPL
ncbi:MAG: hypothetical protein SF066_17390 [Thermoanaerobaculia bacterium]|nr:hypothetical protein [Thermoanaerobaculia bacterium]